MVKRGSMLKSDFSWQNLVLFLVVFVMVFSFVFVVKGDVSGFTIKKASNNVQFMDQGTFINTEYDNGIVLKEGEVSGSYLSDIFDGGEGALWNNISWEEEIDSLIGSEPILYYPFEENADDFSDNGNDGSMSNSLTFVEGKIGNALNFPGDTSAVSVADPLNQVNTEQEWTVSSWVNIEDTGKSQHLANRLNLGIRLVNGNTDKLLTYIHSSYYSYSDMPGLLTGKGWKYVTFVFRHSDKLKKIYVDGKDVTGVGPQSTPEPYGNIKPWLIGYGVKGSLDEFKVWDRALTKEEIRANYNGAKTNFETYVRFCNVPDCSGVDFIKIDSSPYHLGISKRYFQYKFVFEGYPKVFWPKLKNVAVDYTSKSMISSTNVGIEEISAGVSVDSILDNSLPTVSASATILNEGDVSQEYQYKYCVSKSQLSGCGSSLDIDFGSGAKLLSPGEDWNTVLTLDNVAGEGVFWFKLDVSVGDLTSSSSKSFVVGEDLEDEPLSDNLDINVNIVNEENSNLDSSFIPESGNEIDTVAETYGVSFEPGKVEPIGFPKNINLKSSESFQKDFKISNSGEGELTNVRLEIFGLPDDAVDVNPVSFDVIKGGESGTFEGVFDSEEISAGEYNVKFLVTSDQGIGESEGVIMVEGVNYLEYSLIAVGIFGIIFAIGLIFFFYKKNGPAGGIIDSGSDSGFN